MMTIIFLVLVVLLLSKFADSAEEAKNHLEDPDRFVPDEIIREIVDNETADFSDTTSLS